MSLWLTHPLIEMSTRHFLVLISVHVLTVLIPGSLNLLEPTGPVQACNGIALPPKVNGRCRDKLQNVNTRAPQYR